MWSPKRTPNFTPWLPVSAVLSPCLLRTVHTPVSASAPAFTGILYTHKPSILTSLNRTTYLQCLHPEVVDSDSHPDPPWPSYTHSNWSPSNNTPAFHKHSVNKAGDNWKQFYTFITDILFRFGPGNSVINFTELSTAFLLVSIIFILLAYNCFTTLC